MSSTPSNTLQTTLEEAKEKSLKRVYEVDSGNKIVKTCIGKETIEREIAKHDRKYFIDAYSMKVLESKTCNKLQNDSARERALNEQL